MSTPLVTDKGAVQTEDQRLEVVRGKVNGTGYIRKFGRNPTPASTVAETVWDGSTAGDYPFLSAPTKITISSNSDFDGNLPANQGAQSVHIYGLLSGTWALSDEIVAMSGTSVDAYERIYRAHVQVVGLSGVNVGDVLMSGADAVAYAKIFADNGQTHMAVYTIPSGVTGYLDSWRGGVNADNATTVKFGHFDLITRSGTTSGTNSRRIRDTMTIKDDDVTKIMDYPIILKEMCDVWVQFTAGAVNTVATGGFNIRLENNS